MDKPISVLIVGGEAEENVLLASRIADYEELQVAGIAEDNGAALRLLRERNPEAMILNQGKKLSDSIGLLRDMRKLELPVSPYVLVVTEVQIPVSYEIAWDYGANFIIERFQRGYSIQFVVNFLTVILSQLHHRVSMSVAPAESPEQRKKRLVTRICAELDRLGVSLKLKGYRYLVIGIRIMVERTTKSLYADIAAEVGKSSASVERAMRNAITLTWNEGDEESLSNFTAKLSPGKTVPTVREFVSFYAGKLRLEFE